MSDPVPTSAAAGVSHGSWTSGVATLAWHTRGTTCEVVLSWDGVAPAETTSPDPGVVDEASTHLRRLVEELAAAPTPVEVVLAADHPGDRVHPLPEAVADAVGLSERRDLFQLRRPLPVPPDHPLRAGAPTVHPRAFVPGADEAAWIRANNRSFADHPDQGAETPATLADRMAEPWFDPADFLVLDDDARPGELAGSCWTKVHAATETDPPLGEIYVIGVDPARQGEHLGPGLVLAGLDHLTARGLATAVLYVDETNTGARRLYDRLGFATHARRRVYRAPSTDRTVRP